jgi:hypothetical protein
MSVETAEVKTLEAGLGEPATQGTMGRLAFSTMHRPERLEAVADNLAERTSGGLHVDDLSDPAGWANALKARKTSGGRFLLGEQAQAAGYDSVTVPAAECLDLTLDEETRDVWNDESREAAADLAGLLDTCLINNKGVYAKQAEKDIAHLAKTLRSDEFLSGSWARSGRVGKATIEAWLIRALDKLTIAGIPYVAQRTAFEEHMSRAASLKLNDLRSARKKLEDATITFTRDAEYVERLGHYADSDSGSCFRRGGEHRLAPAILVYENQSFAGLIEDANGKYIGRCWGVAGERSITICNTYSPGLGLAAPCLFAAAAWIVLKDRGIDPGELETALEPRTRPRFLDYSVDYIYYNSGSCRVAGDGRDDTVDLVASNYSVSGNASIGTCAHCGDTIEEGDDYEYVEGSGMVCRCCIEHDFCWSNHSEEYILHDEAVWVNDSDTFIADDHPDLCQSTEGTYFIMG